MADELPVADMYDALAEAYAARADTKPHNAYYERPATLSLLPDVVGKRVLDAGCGPGIYTEWLVRSAISYRIVYRVSYSHILPSQPDTISPARTYKQTPNDYTKVRKLRHCLQKAHHEVSMFRFLSLSYTHGSDVKDRFRQG